MTASFIDVYTYSFDKGEKMWKIIKNLLRVLPLIWNSYRGEGQLRITENK